MTTNGLPVPDNAQPGSNSATPPRRTSTEHLAEPVERHRTGRGTARGLTRADAEPAALLRPIPDITQPVPAPTTPDEYWALVDSGVLIDLAGRPLIWQDCPLCGTRTVVGTTCPISLPCPLPGCGARAGRRRCLRPSGHDAAQLHRARVQAAERIDEDRIAAGAVFFPAPWPRPIQGELFDLLTTN